MTDRTDAAVAVLLAGLVFAALGALWFLTPSRLLRVCAVVGLMGVLSLVLTIPVVARRDGRVASVLAVTSLLSLFGAPAGVALLALHWGVTSTIQIILLVALSFVFFYYGLLVPLALSNYLFGEDHPHASEPYPTVSVILPAYNEEGVVGRSVEAILEAVYPEEKLDVVVVDDGSTDGTYRELTAFEDDVRVVRKRNGGKYSALNYGLLYARGEVIVTVDADSIVERTALLKLVGVLQADPDVGAVAGNVKVENRTGALARVQALEYVVGIGVFQRALDSYGSVTVVPGALGAYRRDVLEETGFYDPDTITEDFDTTVKVLKQGSFVRARDARTYTLAPTTWRDLYRQRLRWYRGNFATLVKHRDVFVDARFGVLHQLAFPLTLLSMALVPVAGLVVVAAIVVGVLAGQGTELAVVFAVFAVLQVLLSLFAVRMEGEDARLVLYAPLFVVGYRQFCDVVMLRSVADVLLGRELEWTRPRRVLEPSESEHR